RVVGLARGANNPNGSTRDEQGARELEARAACDERISNVLCAGAAPPQEEGEVVRGIAIVLAITGALALSGIAASAPAQAGRLASTRYGCDPSGGPYPGYAPPHAHTAVIFGFPHDFGGATNSFYL